MEQLVSFDFFTSSTCTKIYIGFGLIKFIRKNVPSSSKCMRICVVSTFLLIVVGSVAAAYGHFVDAAVGGL